MTSIEGIIEPSARADFLAADDIEQRLAKALNAGALANGWLVIGGEGSGKATLAFRLARSLLWVERPTAQLNLSVPETSRAYSLVASGGHPDLFVASRAYDDKKERYASEISVDTIRDLTHFMSHTASMGGWRVAIIDTADDLNRNSANALLKVLEEPPPKTAIFLLCAVPGRLLATIRSRCRRIDLRPLSDEAVAQFLERDGRTTRENAMRIARAARGRPGFAMSLLLGDGAEAIEAVEVFWKTAYAGGNMSIVAQHLSGKAADGVWPLFQRMLVSKIAEEAKKNAYEGGEIAGRIADLRDEIDGLFARGDALNLDRGQIVLAAGRAFGRAIAAT